MAREKSTATVIMRFTYDDTPYRLLSKGSFSAGYEDMYVIEVQGTDELGDPRWDRAAAWSPKTGGTVHVVDANRLVAAVKQAKREQRGDIVEKIAAFVETFPEGLAIADAIREGRFE